MADTVPLFNLKAVSQQTGLKPDTLRAWERRYGLPCPSRSAGGQRLYTGRDIQILLWLEARQREGMTIARAVALFRQVELRGQDPLQVAGARPASDAGIVQTRASAPTLSSMREQWLAACLAYDRAQADQIAVQAFALSPPETVCVALFQWAVREVGELYRQGSATVQQEHFVTEQAIRRLETLLAASPLPSRPGRVMVACPPGEAHTFGPLLFTYVLRSRGWSVVYLGADVPLAHLDATLLSIRPDLVVLAAQRLQTAAALREIATKTAGLARLAFAGGVFNRLPQVRARIPGFFLGESMADAVATCEALLTTPQAAPSPEPVINEVRVALEVFREHHLSIEAELVRGAPSLGLTPSQAVEATGHLACQLEAALSLGDSSLLESWESVRNPLTEEPSREGLARLALNYLRLAEVHLDERGNPALDWLRRWSAACADGAAA